MLSLRPSTAEDRDFLLEVYASTRAGELALLDWSDADKAAFVEMQFSAQDSYYREHYPDASFDVVVLDGRDVGRLYVDRWPGEIRIMDITLLPEHRNAGVGTSLLRRLTTEAAASSRKLSIHVEVFNPALRLYTRLGFVPVADRGVYLLLERGADGQPAAGSGDDGLVAHAPVVGAQRHQEQRERSEVGVAHGAGLLLDEAPVGGMEHERERDPANGRLPALTRAVGGLLAAGQNYLEGLAVGRTHGEHLADEGREGLAGEAVEHATQPTSGNGTEGEGS